MDQQLPSATNRELPLRVLGVRFGQLDRGLGAGPGLVTVEIESEPAVDPDADARNAEAPERQVRRGHHRAAGQLRPATEVEAIVAAWRAAHGEVVRRPRPSGWPGDHVLDADAVRGHSAVGHPLHPRIETQAIALRLGHARSQPEQREAQPGGAAQDAPHDPPSVNRGRYSPGVACRWQTVHSFGW